MAAHRAGFGTVTLSRRNGPDLAAHPPGVCEEVVFVLVEEVAEVLAVSPVDGASARKAA